MDKNLTPNASIKVAIVAQYNNVIFTIDNGVFDFLLGSQFKHTVAFRQG